ncbi:MAG: hypothetical protein IT371_24685 [Deltaproteobacteria bacterium]|nr:hypothetical protein [Deltaproteobacteria bacterium]
MSPPERAREWPSPLGLLWPKVVPHGRAPLSHRLTRLAFFLVGVLVAVGIHQVAVWFLRLCLGVEVVGPLLCRRLLDLVLLVLSSVLLLSNVVTALSSFFLSTDLELLVAAPIPPRVLFAARFAEQLWHSSWMVLAFGVPVLFAFARVAGTGSTFIAVGAVLPPLLLVPAALGTTLSLLLVAALPASRVRGILVGVLFLAFVVLYVLARLVEPERFLNPEGFASMVTFLASLSSPSPPLLPSHWAAQAVASTFRDAAGQGSPALMFAALVTAAGASTTVASLVFRRWHRLAYSRSHEGRTVARVSRLWGWLRRRPVAPDGALRAPGRRGAEADWLRAAGLIVPRGAPREFLIKDLKLLLRDASQWSQLVLLLALVFVYLYNFRYFRSIGETGLVGRYALFLLGMGLAAFVTSAVSVRFAFPLVSQEGRMLWLLRAAPLWPGQILRAKLLSTLPPLLFVSEVLSIASSAILGATPSMMLLGAIVAALTALTVAALSIGVGALLPDYKAESAAKVAASFGGLVCMTISIVVSLTFVALAAYPAYLLHRGLPDVATPLLVAGLAALAISAGAVVLPLWLGSRAFARAQP